MIDVFYSPKGWSYKDVYHSKSGLTKNELLYEINESNRLEYLYNSKCSYLAFSQ